MDKWEEVRQHIRKLEEEPFVDQELLKTMDHISLIDYWKRKSEEEHDLLMSMKRRVDELEIDLKRERTAKDTDLRAFDDRRRLWDKEREALEEKLLVKEREIQLLRERSDWEHKYQEAIKGLAGANGQNLSADGETIVRETKRIMREMESMRDSTEQIAERTRWLERQREKFMELMESAARPVIDLSQVQHMNEAVERISLQMALLQESLDKKTLKEVSQDINVNSPAPSKGDSLVMVGAPATGSGGVSDEALQAWQENLQSFHVIQEDVARGFCHKARNLLGIISGTAQIALSDDKLSAEMKENVTTIDQNVTLLMDSIEEFLALTRVTQMTYENIDLNAIVQEAAAGGIQCKLGQGVPAFRGDKKLITEAVGHVIENARQAGAEPSGILLTTTFNSKTNAVELAIKDNGKGISESHMKKVFQPYFTTKKEQRGLGLSKAQRTVALHGGKISVESTKGQGATFHLQFPVS